MVWDFGAYGVTGFNYEGDESRVLIKITNVCGRVSVEEGYVLLSPSTKHFKIPLCRYFHTSSIVVTTLPCFSTPPQSFYLHSLSVIFFSIVLELFMFGFRNNVPKLCIIVALL